MLSCPVIEPESDVNEREVDCPFLFPGQEVFKQSWPRAKAPLRLTVNRRITSRDLQIVEVTNELLEAEVPEPEGVASNDSLLRGFNATIPSAEKGKSRRW
jgi:hypothetical protein